MTAGVRAVIACVMLLVPMSAFEYAQATTGTIVGTLVDHTDGVLPGVNVLFTNIRTGQAYGVVTNSAGHYAASLPGGSYDISFLLSNSQSFTARGLSLLVNDRLQITGKLVVGAIEALTMTMERPVQPVTAAQNVEQLLAIQEQPLLTRAFGQVVTLVPGVPGDLHEGICFCGPGNYNVSMNGFRRSVINALLGDASNSNGWINYTSVTTPSLALINEASGISTSLINLGLQRTVTGDPAAAKPLLERALAIREAAFGPDHVAVAGALDALGGLLLFLHDDDGARAQLERALRIREAAYGAGHVDTLRTLVNLAVLYQATGDYTRARQRYDRAFALAAGISGPADPPTLNVLSSAAMVLKDLGSEFSGAAQLNTRALELIERAFGPTDPRLWIPLDNLAIDLRELGDYRTARTMAERSLAIAEGAFGPNRPEVAKSLHTLAMILADLGEYEEGMRSFERATRINEQLLPPSDRDVSRAIWFIPSLFPPDLLPLTGYNSLVDIRFQGLTVLYRTNGGPTGPHANELRTYLAAVLSSADDYKMTRPLFELSLMSEKQMRPDHPEVAAAATNLAYVLSHIGYASRANELYEHALNIWEKKLGPDHPRVAIALRNLGRIQLEARNYDAAKPLLIRALKIQEEKLGPKHPEVATTLTALGDLAARVGTNVEAFDAAMRAEDIRREHMRLTARTLPERLAVAYVSSGTGAIELMLSIATSHPDIETTRTTWNDVIRARGMVLDEMAARNRVVNATGDQEVARLATALATARQRLAAAAVRGAAGDSAERYRLLLDQAHAEKNRAERDLAERSAGFRGDPSRSRIGVSEIAAALPSGAALIGFVRFERYGLESSGANPSGFDRQPSYAAFVMRAGAAPAVIPLASATRIEHLIIEWRRQLYQEAMAAGRAAARSEADYRRVATTLRQEIWDPLLGHLSGVTRVFIVPDGALHFVSFAALPQERSKYLVETGPLIHYLSAERDLVSTKTTPADGGLLALGGPDFDVSGATSPSTGMFRGARSSCSDFQSMRFDPLPATVKEVDEVVSLWNRPHSGTESETPIQAIELTGAAASESAFKAQAAGRRVLHLATHGFFLGDRCTAPDPVRATTQTEPLTRIARENPLLLSGLILAGANRRNSTAPDQEDGVLTAEEVAALNLDGVEWAVLSGCDTGVGEVKVGEGVFGLRRAFQVAGVKTVIMSLWPVEDQATRGWMRALYQGRLMKHLSTADAMREASLELLRQRRAKGLSTHPFYWAGFVAAGDWR